MSKSERYLFIHTFLTFHSRVWHDRELIVKAYKQNAKVRLSTFHRVG